jgi:poly-gamma-glutamate capsule biosynthesis protein CapA/YwtB (metallophosphatase superfamily)
MVNRVKKRQLGNIIIGVGAVLVVVAMTPVPGGIFAIAGAVIAFSVGIALALSKS